MMKSLKRILLILPLLLLLLWLQKQDPTPPPSQAGVSSSAHETEQSAPVQWMHARQPYAENALAAAFDFQQVLKQSPEERKERPQPFSAVGELRTAWQTRIDTNGKLICEHQQRFTTEDSVYEVEQSGNQPIQPGTMRAVNGALQGNRLVLSPEPLRALAPKELQAAQQLFPEGNPDRLDPVTGRPGTQAALLAGKIYYFSSSEVMDAVARELRQPRLRGFSWLAGNTGGDQGGGDADATPYQPNQIQVLFIRAEFPDLATSTISKSDLENNLSSVNSKIDDYSYGQAGLTYTVTDQVYTLPEDGSYYAADFSRNDEIHADARVLASAQYNLDDYDVIGVYFPRLTNLPGSQIRYGGYADIGSRAEGSSLWINGSTSIEVLFHEFGHNYGLYHANYLHPEMQLSGSYDLPGILEYGDIFDTMGDGNSPEAHFNQLAKNQLQWIPDSKVAEANADGTWRIYRFDDPNALSNPTLALKVPMGDDVYYWVGFRQRYTNSSYNLANAAYVVGENLGEGRETTLIDMTPDSQLSESADRNDAGLPVGSSYTDSTAGVTFESLATGGSGSNSWIDVQIRFQSRIGFQTALLEVDEQAGTIRIPVSRNLGSTGSCSVYYSSSDDSATSPDDFYAVSGTLTWEDGDTDDKFITLALRPDILNEGIETLSLNLSTPLNAVLETNQHEVNVSILDPGQRYASFAPGFFNQSVNSIVPLDNGQVLIGGNIYAGIGDASDIRHIARLNPDGSVDSSFITGSGFNAEVNVILQMDDGRLLVGGAFTSYNGVSCGSLVRLSADGILDSSFNTALGSGANNEVLSLAIENDGGILVGGSFDSFDGAAAEGLVRLNPTGSRNTTSPLNLPFDTGWGTDIYALLVQSDGKIMVGGSLLTGWTGSGFGAGIIRLHPNGSQDINFDPDAGTHASGSTGSIRSARSIEALSDGKYLITGTFTAYDEEPAPFIARLNSNGSFDTSFTPPAFTDDILTQHQQANGRHVVGGRFLSPTRGVERLLENASADSTFYPQNAIRGGSSFPNNYSVRTIQSDAEGALYVGGNFFGYNGESTRPVIRIAGGVTPYELWQQEQFSSAQILAGNADPDADPENDGLVNLAEMAMGSNPNVADAEGLLQVAPGSGIEIVEINGQQYLQISISKPTSPAGVWYSAQFSSDLSNWTPSPAVPGAAGAVVVEDSSSRYTVRDAIPISPASPRFGRVVLMLPE